MAPRLKGSCFIFLLIWVFCTAYWMAVSKYSGAYIVPHEKMTQVDWVMRCTCVIGGLMALTGCWCIFCDVSSFPYILLYIIPTGIIIPGLCVYGIIQNNNAKDITKPFVNESVIKFWQKHSQSPEYLAKTERFKHCCGLTGPTNYRQYIYGEHCNEQTLDVPYSCCNIHFVNNDHGNSLTMLARNATKYCNHTSLFRVPDQSSAYKCGHVNTSVKLAIDKKYRIYREGCLDILMDDTRYILDVHSTIFIFYLLMSLAMFAVFLNNWWNILRVSTLISTMEAGSTETIIIDDVKPKSHAAVSTISKKAI